jgi:predicted HTH transcriptional regulator
MRLSGASAWSSEAASEFFRPIRKLTRHELETLRLVTTYQGRIVPTVGGVLLFGADRLNHYPYAWIAENAEAGLSTSQIAERLELSPRATRTRLISLVERGLIVEIGSGPQDPHRRYHLAVRPH